MTRTRLFRASLVTMLALAIGVQGALAQPPCQTRSCLPPSSDSNRNVIWYIVGGVAGGIVALFLGTRLFPPPERGLPPLPQSEPPPPQQTSLPPLQPAESPTVLRGKGAPKGTAVSRNGFNLPPPGETRFVANEVMLDIPASVSEVQLEAIARRHSMTRLETKTFRLTGRRLHRWRIEAGGTVPDMIRGVMGERLIAGAQPIYLFALAQIPIPPMNADQYAPQKLNVPEAHRIATGARIVVAVVDSGIDATHPDLSGAIVRSYDAAGGTFAPHAHGTGMAGALAARRTVLGVAPRVGVLAVRAFDPRAHNGEGTTFNIIKGLDWAVENGARIINMSFAGPADPRMRDALGRASKKGVVLIAAAGNAGANSPPLYPAADSSVIAVTATDVEDALYTGANRGSHIAVAAPGVEVLVPAPGGGYQFTTGTSVAAAHVSGVVALLMERNPRLTPADVRRILTRTAKSLGRGDRSRDYGAGLVDALNAVNAASSPTTAARKK
jgi:subtilisin family serine protease